jgi:hypothetical protein
VAEVGTAATMIVNDSDECPLCTLGPPPDMILRLPPPPAPGFLVHSAELTYPGDGTPFLEHFNSSPCKHSCEWRAKGVQFVEMPQQGEQSNFPAPLSLSPLLIPRKPPCRITLPSPDIPCQPCAALPRPALSFSLHVYPLAVMTRVCVTSLGDKPVL